MPKLNTKEKTPAPLGLWSQLSGWAGSAIGGLPYVGSLWKATVGTGAADGQSPYSDLMCTGGGYGLTSITPLEMAGGVWLPYTLPRYRIMGRHPTLALAKMTIALSVLAAECGVVADDDLADDPVAQKGKRILEVELNNRRREVLVAGLQSLEYGFKVCEVVYGRKTDPKAGAYTGVAKIKQQPGECVTFDADDRGTVVAARCNGATLDTPYYLHFVHGGEDGNPWGLSRHENARRAWENWLRLDDLRVTLTNKVTGRAPYVGVPADDPDDPAVIAAKEAGEPTPNQKEALKLANNLFAGKPAVYSNTAGIDAQDLRTSPDLASGKLVDVEFLDIGEAGPAISAISATIEYYDKLLLRAWFVPERAAIEATTSGSRADSEQHGTQTSADVETTHESLVEQAMTQVGNALIRENCGEAYVGRIRWTAMTAQDEQQEALASFRDRLMDDPAFRTAVIKAMDVNGIEGLIRMSGVNVKIDPKKFAYEPTHAEQPDKVAPPPKAA